MEQEKQNENIPQKNKKNHFLKGALFGALIALLIVFSAKKIMNLTDNDSVVDKRTEQKLELIKGLIGDQYLHSDEINEKEVKESLIKGYVNGLGDPYSVYFDEEETKELAESTSGEFSGIGVAMQQDIETGAITFVNVYENSPAAEAGLKDGDILYKVEDEDVASMTLNEIVAKVRGKEGTKITLTVFRGDDGKEYETTVTRRKIESQTVEYEMKEDQIGYIRITEFDQVTYEQFKSALEELQSQDAKGIVMDVRGNPGGNLGTVCDILDLILPEGLIVYTEDKDGKREEYSSDAKHSLDLPMTVLIDGRSASASEIFAGAIQDYELGKLVGSTTYGKGVVQQIFPLTDGTSVKLTIAEYFTPKGRNIHGKGIEPDVEQEYVYDEQDPDHDNQLEKAIEVLKQEIEKVE